MHDDVPHWGPVATVLIIISPIASGIAATAAFSYVVVSRMQPLIEKRSEVLVSPEAARDDAAETAERVRLAQFTARAVPFLESVARQGVVTPADRALAGQLARRLRDDLVTQSNVSWLDSVASGSRLVVIDPEHRAGKMRAPQRTALRALLQAILDTPGTDAGSLLVELRECPRRIDSGRGQPRHGTAGGAPHHAPRAVLPDARHRREGPAVEPGPVPEAELQPAGLMRSVYDAEIALPAEPSCLVASTTRAAIAVSASLPQARGS